MVKIFVCVRVQIKEDHESVWTVTGSDTDIVLFFDSRSYIILCT